MRYKGNIFPFNHSLLKEKRKQECFTQFEVGKGIGYNGTSGRTVSAIEKGRLIPTEERERALEKFFRVEEGYFRKPNKK